MSSIHMHNRSIKELSATGKLAFSYLAAHLTAISLVGTLYLLGLFDVGFLSPESLGVKLFNYFNTFIA